MANIHQIKSKYFSEAAVFPLGLTTKFPASVAKGWNNSPEDTDAYYDCTQPLPETLQTQKGKSMPLTGWGVNLRLSGLVVVDLDVNHLRPDGSSADGIASWKSLVREMGVKLPRTLVVRTMSGGLHLWFKAPSDVELPTLIGKLGDGIDFKASGMVVGPGTKAKKRDSDGNIVSEGEYAIEKDYPIADAPTWLVSLVKKTQEEAQANRASELPMLPALGDFPDRYAKKALESAFYAVSNAPQGERSDTVNREAFGAAKAGAPVAKVVEDLTRAAMSYGDWSESDLRRTILRSATDGARAYVPRVQDLPASTASFAKSSTTVASSPSSKPALPKVDESLDGLSGDEKKQREATAQRAWRLHYDDESLVARFLAGNQDYCFVEEYEQWMRYDKDTGIWSKTNEAKVRGAIREGFLLPEFEEAASSTSGFRKTAAEVLRKEATSRRVLNLLATATVASARLSDFDSHKDLVVVANGVVDLRTSELKPFSPDLRFTKRIPYPFVAGAKNVYTDLAIDSLPPDCHEQVQIMAGQALTGHQPSRSNIFFFWGGGGNGKSTLIDLLSTTAGDYGKKPKREVLIKGGSDSNFHTISFKGARQALIEELPDERFLDGGVVRDLAGTTTMTGEHKGKDVEEFEVEATIFITFNNRPQVTETAHGVWRRLKLFQFPYTYVETEREVVSPSHKLQNPMLKDLHRKSDEAVIAFLAWRIEGARRWYEADRTDPADAPSVVSATHAWRMSNDVLAHWFEENIVADPNALCLVDDLLEDFNQWRNSPKAAWGKHNLVDKLTSHSLFQEHNLEYKQAARHTGLTQSLWMNPNSLAQARKQVRLEQKREHGGQVPGSGVSPVILRRG